MEGEAVEESDDDPDVGAEEGEEDAGLVTAEPELLGLLAVAEEGVEEGGGEQAQLVAQQLQEGGGHVRPVALVGLSCDDVSTEEVEEKKESQEMGPDVHRFIV